MSEPNKDNLSQFSLRSRYVYIRPSNAPDHPYYHRDTLSNEQLRIEGFKESLSSQFFWEIYHIWEHRAYGQSGPLPKDPMVQAANLEKGPLEPATVISLFENFRNRQRISHARVIADEFKEKSSLPRESIEVSSLLANENLKLGDVLNSGMWLSDLKSHRGQSAPDIRDDAQDVHNLEQVTALIEEALNLSKLKEGF